jgi:phage tail sheath protein FI
MPEYLTPGVYVEEFEIGARPIEGVSTSTAGFLGLAERGPYQPVLVTSLGQYMRIYGGYTPDSYLTYAVEGFFNNGGQRCYIGRIVRLDHTDPKLKPIATTASVDVGPISFKAIGEGVWGSNVAVRIENPSTDPADPTYPNKFKLSIAYWSKNRPAFQIPPAPADPKKKLNELMLVSTDLSG